MIRSFYIHTQFPKINTPSSFIKEKQMSKTKERKIHAVCLDLVALALQDISPLILEIHVGAAHKLSERKMKSSI